MSLTANNKKDIERLLKDIGNILVIDGNHYKEITNVLYEIPYKEPQGEFKPDLPNDDKEREYLIKTVDNHLDLFLIDLNTRRFAFPNIYPDSGLCQCICMVHLFIRGSHLHINEYYRSQNFERNYDYDCETACMLMKTALAKLQIVKKWAIKPGRITVFCASLHNKLK